MSPWKTLYAMTWIVVVEFLLGMMPDAPAIVGWAHVALGFVIVALAFVNFRGVVATNVPGRVKRTARASMQLSVALALLGVLLLADVGRDVGLFGVSVWGLILFLHVFLAIAVLAQAAAVGISYDMWEEKEFLEWTSPGEIPAAPGAGEQAVAPAPARASRGPNRPGTL